MQATPTILEIPVFAGVFRNDRRLLMGVIDGEFPIFDVKATAWRPLCGASRHVLEAAKVGNKLLIFRVTVTLADMEPTGAGANAPAFFCFMGAVSGTPIMAAEEKAIFCMFVLIHGYTISRLSDLHPSQRSVALCQEVSEKS